VLLYRYLQRKIVSHGEIGAGSQHGIRPARQQLRPIVQGEVVDDETTPIRRISSGSNTLSAVRSP
jgi:hypothetical protein